MRLVGGPTNDVSSIPSPDLGLSKIIIQIIGHLVLAYIKKDAHEREVKM